MRGRRFLVVDDHALEYLTSLVRVAKNVQSGTKAEQRHPVVLARNEHLAEIHDGFVVTRRLQQRDSQVRPNGGVLWRKLASQFEVPHSVSKAIGMATDQALAMIDARMTR